MDATAPFPLPVADDPDTGGFFEAARRGELAVKFCLDCDAPIHLPAPACGACHSLRTGWRAVRPSGSIYSFTVTERMVHPAFPPPYTVLLVESDEVPGVRWIGFLEGAPDVRIGEPVDAAIEVRDGSPLVRWRRRS